MIFKIILVCGLVQLALISARTYDRCQLARELLNVYKFPRGQIGTWICIVQHESNYNTSAFNPTTGDHGLFQISQIYWCGNQPLGCHVQCDALRNDDISDDVNCVRQVFDETQRLKGNGFEAWTTYKFCKGNQDSYLNGCGI